MSPTHETVGLAGIILQDALIRYAGHAARLSSHWRTQVGCVLVPAGTNFDRPGWMQRLVLGWNMRHLHAEAHCLLRAARYGVQTDGATLYCTWAACPACAEAIIAAGVQRVVSAIDTREPCPHRWRDEVNRGIDTLREASVLYQTHRPERKEGDAPVAFKFNGERVLL